MKPSFKKNALYMVIGNGVFASSQWMIIIIISNWGSILLLGQYSLALAIVSPIFLLTNLGLRQVITTDVNREWSLLDYVKLRILTLFIACLIVAIFLLFSSNDSVMLGLIIVLTSSKMIDGLMDIMYGFFQQHHRLDIVGLSRIFSGIIGIIFFAISFVLFNDVHYAVLTMILGWIISWFVVGNKQVYEILTENKIDLKFRFGTFVKPLLNYKLFWLAFPLGWTALLISLRTNIPRYFIEIEVGTAELGVFAATGYLINLMGIVVSALGRTALPKLAELAFHHNREEFIRILSKLLLFGFLIGIISIVISVVWSESILILFYGPELAVYNDILVYMMVIATVTFLCSFINYAMEALRIFKHHFIISLVTTSTCLLACFALVESYGMIGACLAWLISLSVQIILSAIIIYNKLSFFKYSDI